MIKAILFDLDMTLLDRDALYEQFADDLITNLLPKNLTKEEAFEEKQHLIRLDAHGYGSKATIYEPLIEKYHLNLTLSDVVERWARFSLTNATPFPESEEALQRLSERFRLAIITNGEQNVQENKLKASGLEGYFERVVISGGVGMEKPSPEIFLWTLKQMELSSNEVLYVGDHWRNDVQGALSAGIRPVWINRAGTNEQDVYQISSLLDLPDLVRSIECTELEQWPDMLVRWYEENKRDLPWRQRKDPYAIWISEIMLQQTRVETVIAYYERFMQAFPTIRDLAQAHEEQVLKLWEGLGYYSRARNILCAARYMEETCGGQFPVQHEAILALPGIGDYTAGAISSIAYDEPYPAVDGNVLRVLSRLYRISDDILNTRTKKWITNLDASHIPQLASASFTQGLMDLGATVCIPGVPRCEKCPLREDCKSHLAGCENEIPKRRPKHPPREEHRAVFLIQRENNFLITRREENQVLGGLWEFPGVTVEEDASEQEILSGFETHYGLTLQKVHKLMKADHTFSHIHWDMQIYEAASFGEPSCEHRWVDEDELERVMLPSAFQKPLQYIKGLS